MKIYEPNRLHTGKVAWLGLIRLGSIALRYAGLSRFNERKGAQGNAGRNLVRDEHSETMHGGKRGEIYIFGQGFKSVNQQT